jgi:hypothetical protein
MSAIEDSPDSVFISLDGLEEEDRRQVISQYFSGDMLRWAGRRAMEFGDVIAPKVVYVEVTETETHSVAWVEHAGVNTATYEIFHNHHIVCDCVLCKNFNDGRGGIDTSLCDAMTRALEARAGIIGAEFQRDVTASQKNGLINLMTGSLEKSREFDLESFSVNAIEQVLRSDNRHPEIWHGNAVSGSLSVDEVSHIIDQPATHILLAAEKLRKSGKADFDGENIRLAA